ncbi:MAG TPA: hypothetical protein VL752_13280 [Acidisoma sp.]|uniref:hypothetical protein n=1 Tax=Acidisoma sp. TaxID=1872115 RepID=UPI002BA9EE4C|nr:hypothetical protein [Acidisoma sp.]HTI01913.1 hypothetical protein [Acidisoma sp.]
MSAIELHLGPLRAEGYNILRSGVRWLCESGQYCGPNQVFAYCNIILEPTTSRLSGPPPFADELELQIAFASRVGGTITTDSSTARGGYLSVRTVDAWNAETVIASITPDPGAYDRAMNPSRLRLLALAGRRMTALADTHSGLLPGWHGRTRGWWCDEGETPVTLLSLGVCDATGLILGEQCAFLEMFETTQMAAQMVSVPDHPLAPATPLLLDQLQRTPQQFDAIAGDLRSFFSRSATAPTPDDLMFAGTILSVMQRNPIRDSYSIFSANGLARLGPADAVLLSLAVEPSTILRHRKLGYHIHIMRHHQVAAGPAVRAWLAESFEPVRRSVNDIKQDYITLIDKIARTTGGRVIILNRMSTSGYEDVSSYLAFDAPLSDTLSLVAAKEWNLMLEDVADERELHIVDVDAIAADIGGAEHLPDGIHQSGLMQTLLRQEVRGILSDLRRADAPLAAAVR